MKFEDVKDSYRAMSKYLEEIKPRGTQVTWDIGTYLHNANRKVIGEVQYSSKIHKPDVVDELIKKLKPS